MLEFIVFAFITYMLHLGENINNILYTNFIIIFYIGFGFIFMILLLLVLPLIMMGRTYGKIDTDTKWEKDKWD